VTNDEHRLVIVGGSDAGIAAGIRAHALDPSIEPLVIVADASPNFSICGLPFYISGETPAWQNLAHRSRKDRSHGRAECLSTRA
jgi:NADPH-dependent 2,4-dienoyl-CoA reductase/sulfur reductase-like enzyme